MTTTDLIKRAAQKHGVDPDLLSAMVSAESSGNPEAVSGKKAKGLMQLTPITIKEIENRFGYTIDDPFDPEQNIEGGTLYIKHLLDKYEGDTDLALAAYNAGPGSVAKYGGIPPFKETQNYISKITAQLPSAEEMAQIKPVTMHTTPPKGGIMPLTDPAELQRIIESPADPEDTLAAVNNPFSIQGGLYFADRAINLFSQQARTINAFIWGTPEPNTGNAWSDFGLGMLTDPWAWFGTGVAAGAGKEVAKEKLGQSFQAVTKRLGREPESLDELISLVRQEGIGPLARDALSAADDYLRASGTHPLQLYQRARSSVDDFLRRGGMGPEESLVLRGPDVIPYEGSAVLAGRKLNELTPKQLRVFKEDFRAITLKGPGDPYHDELTKIAKEDWEYLGERTLEELYKKIYGKKIGGERMAQFERRLEHLEDLQRKYPKADFDELTAAEAIGELPVYWRRPASYYRRTDKGALIPGRAGAAHQTRPSFGGMWMDEEAGYEHAVWMGSEIGPESVVHEAIHVGQVPSTTYNTSTRRPAWAHKEFERIRNDVLDEWEKEYDSYTEHAKQMAEKYRKSGNKEYMKTWEDSFTKRYNEKPEMLKTVLRHMNWALDEKELAPQIASIKYAYWRKFKIDITPESSPHQIEQMFKWYFEKVGDSGKQFAGMNTDGFKIGAIAFWRLLKNKNPKVQKAFEAFARLVPMAPPVAAVSMHGEDE